MSMFLENPTVMLEIDFGYLESYSIKVQNRIAENSSRTNPKKTYDQYHGTFWGELINSDILNKTQGGLNI